MSLRTTDPDDAGAFARFTIDSRTTRASLRAAAMPASNLYLLIDAPSSRSVQGGRNIFGSGPRAVAAARPSLDCRRNRTALGHVRQSHWPLPSHLQHRLHDGLRDARSELRGRAPTASPPRFDHRHVAVGSGTVSRGLALLRER